MSKIGKKQPYRCKEEYNETIRLRGSPKNSKTAAVSYRNPHSGRETERNHIEDRGYGIQDNYRLVHSPNNLESFQL